MAETSLTRPLEEDFSWLFERFHGILGIIVFGSNSKGEQLERSDLDICLVDRGLDAPQRQQLHKKIAERVDLFEKHYDMLFFSEIPWYLKGEILENGKVAICPDQLEMYEYPYKYRRIWEDQRARQQISRQEMLDML